MTYPEYEEAKRQHEADIATNPEAWGLPPTRHTHFNGQTHIHGRGNLPHTHATVTQSANGDLAKWQAAWGKVVWVESDGDD